MHLRTPLLALLVLFATVASGLAELRIRSAYYGRPDNNRDVKQVLENYVRHGIYSFRVSGRSMGVEPNPGRTDYLRVVYDLNGRRQTTDAQEGQLFTFAGISETGKIGSYYTATVRISNGTSQDLAAYSIDRYGVWRWQAFIPPGGTATDTGIVGQRWAVSNRAGVVLRQFTIEPRENRVYVDAPRRRR